MAIDMTRFVTRFVEEAREHIGQLENGIALLETNPQEKENINQIFRSAHTIKGSSLMLKLVTISKTAHKLEDVLGAVRDESITYSKPLGQLLLQAVDTLNQLINIAEQHQPLPELDQNLCDDLTAAMEGKLVENSGEQNVTEASPTELSSLKNDSKQQKNIQASAHSNTLPENGVTKKTSSNAPTKNVPPKKQPEVELKTSDSVRIRVSKLDELIKLMGEVVSTHTKMQHQVNSLKHLEQDIHEEQNTENIVAQIRKYRKKLNDEVLFQKLLMEELHDKTLVMRMLPLSIVFDPAARLVREMARNLGKQVECIISGNEIELDRQMIDKLSDPVVHLLRNAIDHGIEDSESRKAQGKYALAKVKLSAFQEGGWVIITIQDDGSGIALDSIRNKAVSKAIYTEEEAQALSDNELIELIFMPGFSTNAIITDMSGRGVGMDVVHKTIVDDLHGVINVSTGKTGTTFSLKLPLSLAMMRVLLCQVGELTLGFTAQYISTLVYISENESMTLAERKVVNIGSEFIPVVALADLLGIDSKTEDNNHRQLLLVVKTHNEKLALIIDKLVDEMDMVIKPLPKHMKSMALITGMVMTGNNHLVSILNVSHLMSMTSQNRVQPKQNTTKTGRENYHVLVVDDSLNTREIEKDILEASGYRVSTAVDGIDGWNKANGESFDAILTDVEMPNMDGFSLTMRLREQEKFKHTPIIIVTSREKAEDKRRGIEVGADAYIVKGDFEQSNLVDTLNNLLG